MSIEKMVYRKWQDKEITDIAALEAMCRTLTGVQDSLEPLKEMEREVRNQVSQIVDKIGGKVTVPGFGKLTITEPVLIESYDRALLDELIEQLETEGQTKQADQIRACRKQTARVGSLRIDRAMNLSNGGKSGKQEGYQND